jgi:hypothetical protein
MGKVKIFCIKRNILVLIYVIIICMAILFISFHINYFIDQREKNTKQLYDQANAAGNIGIPWDELSDKGRAEYLERILLLMLRPSIQETLKKYYGKFKQYGESKIIYIKPVDLKQEIQIQLSTFEGPHNPPYGLDTITLYLERARVEIIDFKHEDTEFYHIN